MVPNELLEELRGTWGPSPKDPERGIIWEESMELLAQVPQLLAETIRRDGTNFDSLIRDLGSLEALANLEVQCVERYLCCREPETLQEVIREITESHPWSDNLQSLSPVRKFRLRERLGEEIANKLAFILITNSRLRQWFFPGD